MDIKFTMTINISFILYFIARIQCESTQLFTTVTGNQNKKIFSAILYLKTFIPAKHACSTILTYLIILNT
jgi:hypothetical protein